MNGSEKSVGSFTRKKELNIDKKKSMVFMNFPLYCSIGSSITRSPSFCSACPHFSLHCTFGLIWQLHKDNSRHLEVSLYRGQQLYSSCCRSSAVHHVTILLTFPWHVVPYDTHDALCVHLTNIRIYLVCFKRVYLSYVRAYLG